jgi:hypothetical protein
MPEFISCQEARKEIKKKVLSKLHSECSEQPIDPLECETCQKVCDFTLLKAFSEDFKRKRIAVDVYMNTMSNNKAHSKRTFLTFYP